MPARPRSDEPAPQGASRPRAPRAAAPSGHDDLAVLAARALDGDDAAWRALVDRLQGVAWKVLSGFDMAEDDRKDAFGSTFFRLFERLGSVREPEKLPGWVATTARNEALTLLRRRSRVVPMADLPVRATGADTIDHAERLLDDELHHALLIAFERLPAAAQALLRLLSSDPPIGYDEISRVLDLPRGSIGPMRQRCLARLRTSPELAGYLEGGSRGAS
jgi:RNA polymerase sigma factor (sigma-70 family)